jgi:hypothetical protein
MYAHPPAVPPMQLHHKPSADVTSWPHLMGQHPFLHGAAGPSDGGTAAPTHTCRACLQPMVADTRAQRSSTHMTRCQHEHSVLCCALCDDCHICIELHRWRPLQPIKWAPAAAAAASPKVVCIGCCCCCCRSRALRKSTCRRSSCIPPLLSRPKPD